MSDSFSRMKKIFPRPKRSFIAKKSNIDRVSILIDLYPCDY